MAKEVNLKFWVLYKMFNIIKNKFQLLYNIIESNNIEKVKYDYYLIIFKFKFWLYMIEIDIYLDEDDKNFVWSEAIFEIS